MPELSELLEALADDGRPRGADEVLRRARARVTARRARANEARRYGRLVVAAAVVAALASASSVLHFRQRDENPPEARAAGNTPRFGTWTEIDFPRSGFEPGARVRAIAHDGQALVAVGSIETATRPPVQAAWTSSDGRRWRRSSGAAFGAGEIDLVVRNGERVVAVGSSFDEPGSRTVWRSEDGRRWEHLTDDAPAGIRSVVAGGPGLVAAGFTVGGDADASNRAAIWTSARGKRWSAVPNGDHLFPEGQIAGLTLDGDRVIAVGTDWSGRRELPHTSVWSSRDGTHWERVPGRTGLQGASVASSASIANQGGELRLLAGEGGAPGLCRRRPGRNAVWASDRGRHWNRISRLGAAPGASLLLGVGEWWLAGGSRGACESTRSVVYISSNGRQWKKAKAAPKSARSISSVNAMSSTADGAVVVVSKLRPEQPGRSGPDVWLWNSPD